MGFDYLCLFSLFCTDLYLSLLAFETSMQFVCLPVCHFVCFGLFVWAAWQPFCPAVCCCFAWVVRLSALHWLGGCDITGLLWHCPLSGPIRLQHSCDDVIAALWLGEPCVSAYVVHAVAPPTSYSMRHAERSDTMLFLRLSYLYGWNRTLYLLKHTDFSCSNLPMPTPTNQL